jgi:hypothetical protein
VHEDLARAQTLRQSGAAAFKYIVVFGHSGIYSSALTHGSLMPLRATLEPLLEQFKVIYVMDTASAKIVR